VLHEVELAVVVAAHAETGRGTCQTPVVDVPAVSFTDGNVMSSSRILFTCRPLSGHFDPLLPLASAARASGHTVAFASGDPVVGRARDAGFVAFEAGPPEAFRADWAPRFPGFTALVGDAQRRFFFTEIFANLELAPRVVDLESIMSSWRPDLVVHEMAELAAPLVSTALGIPYVDVGYGSLIPRALLAEAGAAAAAHWRARGLEPDPLAGVFRYLYVDPCPPALQNPEIADVASVLSMRPAGGEVEAAERPAWFDGLPDRPTAYVTMGTIWNTDLDVFRLLIEALHDHVNLIVTIGRQHDPAALGPQPSGVIIRSYIPQHEVLPWCDVIVTHGGSGTVLGALAHGVPLLVVPQGADQWSNAEQIVAAGAGRRLLRHELSAAAVRDCVMALLGEPHYRQSASSIKEEIRAMPSAADVIAGLEALL
jgi:UDP:flavonoid glycosyltransferase YjiC (YdhE family)